MARQRTYAVDQEIHPGDQWLITDIADNGTKNISVAALAKFFAQSGVADPNRVGFHYTHTDAGTVAAGQFRYEHATTTLAPGNVTGIQVHRYTNRGVDFAPITHLLTGVDIKITDITDSTNTNYAIYSVGNYIPNPDSDTITIPLILRAAAGTLPQGSTVLTTLGNFSNSVTGGTILDGTEDPNGLVAGQAGDIYLHRKEAEQELDVYGPLATANVAPTYDWGVAIQLKGVEGEGVVRVQGHPVTDMDGDVIGTDLEFFVGAGMGTPILERVFVPIGPAGLDGDTISVEETTEGTSTTDGELTITVTDPNPGGGSVQTTATIPHGERGEDGDPIVIVDSMVVGNFFRVDYTIGGVAGMFDIPLPSDGDHGNGIAEMRVQPIVGTPSEYELQVRYETNGVPDANFTIIPGRWRDGEDGTAGDTVVFTETVTADTATDGNIQIVVTHADGTTDTTNVTIPHGVAGPSVSVDGDNVTDINFAGADVTVDVTAGVATVTIEDPNEVPTPTTANTNQALYYNGTNLAWQGFQVRETGDAETPIENVTAIRFNGTGVDISDGLPGEAIVTIQGGGTPVYPQLDAELNLGSTRHQRDTSINRWDYTFSFNSADGFSVSSVTVSSSNADFQVDPDTASPAGTTWEIENTTTDESSSTISAVVVYQEPGDTSNKTVTISGGAVSKYFSSYWGIQDADGSTVNDANPFELTTTGGTSSEVVTIANSDVGRYLIVSTPTGEYPKISTHPDGTPYVLDTPSTASFDSMTYDVYSLEITAVVDLYIKQ